MTNIIDSHQHFWRRARGDYGWLGPELGVLYQDYGPEELTPHLEICDVRATVLVQAAPTVEETRFLLSLADAHDFVAGVVGWVDLESPTVRDTIAELAAHPKLKGVRPMIQDIADPCWISKPELVPAIDALLEFGLRFDALVHTQHIDGLLSMLGRFPDLPVVIDHGAKPPIASGEWQPWADQITEVAGRTNAFCKVSGLLTEADATWTYDDIARYMDHLFSNFGPERLMWGSDWPVLNLATSYRKWLSMAEHYVSSLSAAERALIMRENAIKFYGLEVD